MQVDLVIKNARVVTPGGVVTGGVGVKDGNAAIANDDTLPEAAEVIDSGGEYLLPGLVDPHAHGRYIPRSA